MSWGALSVALHPLLPWPAIAVLGGAYVLLLGFAFFRRARGTAWRLVAGMLLTVALLDPSLIEEQRNYQKDIAVVLVDRSPSQKLGDRTRNTADALAAVTRDLAAFPDLEVKVIDGGQAAEPACQTADFDDRGHSHSTTISASAGMLIFSSCFGSSSSIFNRYTSLTRSC